VAFEVRPSGVEELDRGDPSEVARENALRKAHAACLPDRSELVLGCDTLVALDGVIYGKPEDETAARETLRALGGATHEVVSGLALVRTGGGQERPVTATVRTEVTFRELDKPLMDWYVATGEWRGRSGGYAIQGAGAVLVRRVEGEVENVVGLPVATLLDIYPELLSR
jgi:nucleoside triphosphate pyrophosphatase